MSEYPLVVCICLDPGGKPEFSARVKRSYESQTYVGKVWVSRDTSEQKHTIGKWRNYAISGAVSVFPRTDIIAHFDWDDISAPNRLAVQLEHLRSTGKEVTGLYDMPMYDLKNDKMWLYENPHKERYSLGNCLFYKREAWERVKFPDTTPEDNTWRKNIGGENIETRSVWEDGKPLMIQVVHGANASASIIRSSSYYKEPSAAQEKAIRELLAAA